MIAGGIFEGVLGVSGGAGGCVRRCFRGARFEGVVVFVVLGFLWLFKGVYMVFGGFFNKVLKVFLDYFEGVQDIWGSYD